MDLLRALQSALTVSQDADKIREDAITTTFEWGVVDTCRPTDTGRWETGISVRTVNEGAWRIAEQYDSHEAAISGHIKWAEALEADHSLHCPDVSQDWYGLDDPLEEDSSIFGYRQRWIQAENDAEEDDEV